MSASSRSLEERVTVKTLICVAILAVVLTTFWDVWIAFLPKIAACTQQVSVIIPTPGVVLMGSPFLVLMVTMALIRIPPMRKYLTTKSLAYLYTISLAVAYFAWMKYPWHHIAGQVFARLFCSESITRYMPEFVAPSKDVAELLWWGAGSIGAIPWGSLLPYILWQFLIVALFGCICISLANIFRRQWIDIEMIPFPHATLGYVILANVENSVKPKWLSKTPFLLGILLGFLLEVPVSGVTLFPWFPDILMWRTNTCGDGAHWIAPPDVPWHLGIPKNPPIYALLLLAPLHFLSSIVFYTLVFEIAFFVAFYGFGYYTSMLQMGFCGRNWCAPTPYTDPPLRFFAINVGCVLGFFAITLFLQRRYIVETLKSAFRKSNAELEGEPMSYRSAWVMFLTSFIAMMIFLMYSGLSPWPSFVIILTGIIMSIVSVQLWGRVAMDWCAPCYDFTPGFVRLLVWPTLQWPQVTSADLALGFIPTTVGAEAPWGWGGQLYTAMASYKMAKLTGVNSKNVMKVMVVAMFASMLTTHFIANLILGIRGGSKIPDPIVIPQAVEISWNWLWAKPTAAPMSNVIPWVVVGFIFMVIMRYLCSRILWLPDPLAAIVAWSWTSSLFGIWFASLIVWIIKSVILKLGGSKLYEEWVVPVAGGFIMGTTAEILVAAIASYVMFPPTL